MPELASNQERQVEVVNLERIGEAESIGSHLGSCILHVIQAVARRPSREIIRLAINTLHHRLPIQACPCSSVFYPCILEYPQRVGIVTFHVGISPAAIQLGSSVGSLVKLLDLVLVVRKIQVAGPHNLVPVNGQLRADFQFDAPVGHLGSIQGLACRTIHGWDRHGSHQVLA